MGSPKANQQPKTYVEGTQFENWILVQDDVGPRIKRFYTPPGDKRRVERCPIAKYRHLLKDSLELERFVTRLNGDDPQKKRAREFADLRHAYLSLELLDKYYETVLKVRIPTAKDAQTMNRYLREYGIYFFAIQLGLPNPLDWKREEMVWARSLLNADPEIPDSLRLFDAGARTSSKVLRQIVFELNRFMAYLHAQRPDEVPPLKFEPLTRPMLAKNDADRVLADEVEVSQYIRPELWKQIEAGLEAQNAPWRWPIYLAYGYGLRRNEALGLEPSALRRDYLLVSQQLDCYERVTEQEKAPKRTRWNKRDTALDKPKYRPVKDRDTRKVPHWFLKPDLAHRYIAEVQKMRLHPDQLTAYFTDFTRKLFKAEGLVFHIDDLRPTWITNALDKVGSDKAEEVRLAAGHANIQTTFKHYIKDTRQLGDEVWKPEASA